MAGDIKEKAGTATTLVSSGAGTIASAAASIANATGNLLNSANDDNRVNFRLTCACASAPAQGAVVSLYLAPLTDGSTADDVDASTPYFPASMFAGNFFWPAASAATTQHMSILGVDIEPIDYVPYLVNSLGQTISTLSISLNSVPPSSASSPPSTRCSNCCAGTFSDMV